MSDTPSSISNSPEKQEKIPTAILYNMVADWINHKPGMLPEILRSNKFPKHFRAVKQDMVEDMPTILEQYKDTKGLPLVRFSSLKSMAMEVCRDLRSIAVQDPEYFQLNMTSQSVDKTLYHWAISSTTNGGLPPAMVGHDDGKPAFYRLQYEPVSSGVNPEWQCPTWHEIGLRTTNWEAFCMRVASIFDPTADRKQAIYMSGPKDSGKSQIEAILAHLAGGDTHSGGGYCSLSPDNTTSNFWLQPLVGKRVVCVSEAACDFLESNRFKSLTGDLYHLVDIKNRAAVNWPLPVLLFLFGNEPPEITAKPEIFERIIDCRIDPPEFPDGKGLIPERTYQAILKSELSAFLGYCKQLYEPYRGNRIPNDKKELIADSHDYERDKAHEFLQNHWILDKNKDARVQGNIISKQMALDGIKNPKLIGHIFKIWRDDFGIKSVCTHGVKFYCGMRRCTEAERSDFWYNLDFPNKTLGT